MTSTHEAGRREGLLEAAQKVNKAWDSTVTIEGYGHEQMKRALRGLRAVLFAAAPKPEGLEPPGCPMEGDRTYDFDKGVDHALELLGKSVGNMNWQVREGSEDYDTDVSYTIVGILAGVDLYNEDNGQWASKAFAASEAARKAAEAEREYMQAGWKGMCAKLDAAITRIADLTRDLAEAKLAIERLEPIAAHPTRMSRFL